MIAEGENVRSYTLVKDLKKHSHIEQATSDSSQLVMVKRLQSI